MIRNHATFEVRITDSRDVIPFSERRAYLELALRIKGYLKHKPEVEINQNLNDEIKQRIAEGRKRAAELNAKRNTNSP